jgi:hypothetical protein
MAQVEQVGLVAVVAAQQMFQTPMLVAQEQLVKVTAAEADRYFLLEAGTRAVVAVAQDQQEQTETIARQEQTVVTVLLPPFPAHL